MPPEAARQSRPLLLEKKGSDLSLERGLLLNWGVGALGAVLAGLIGDFNLVASFGFAALLSVLGVGFIALTKPNA